MIPIWECLILPYANKPEVTSGFCSKWVNFYYSGDVLLHVSQSEKEQLELCLLRDQVFLEPGTYEAPVARLLLSERAIALYSVFILKQKRYI